MLSTAEEVAINILVLTPILGHASAGQPAKANIH